MNWTAVSASLMQHARLMLSEAPSSDATNAAVSVLIALAKSLEAGKPPMMGGAVDGKPI